MVKAEEREDVQVLERGNIWFFYRPRVEEHDPSGREDLQQFYVVLHPEKQNARFRLLVIGRQELPKVGEHERDWGFVDMVSWTPRAIGRELEEQQYETKTRGTRHRPAARPAGEGVYAIARHGDHTHLAYALELPRDPSQVQRALRIEDEASYVLTIKNPETPSPRGAGLSDERKPGYPQRLVEVFRGRKFAEADPPDFLDHENAQFVLVGAKADVREELGIDLEPADETCEGSDLKADLRLHLENHPVDPLIEGEWA